MTGEEHAPPTKREPPENLEILNRKARDQAYGLEDLDWSLTVDRERLWSPEEIAPLYYLPSYALLNEAQKIRYNQLFAMGVCEQFIWLEEHILVNTLSKVAAEGRVPPALREALEHFIEEEKKHTAMFWRTLEKSEPSWYPPAGPRKFRLFNISSLQQFLLDVILRHPRTFLVWVWTAVFFEERTVDYCRHYRRVARERPEGMDALYVQLHEYHFKDEARHYQLDQHLLAWLYDPQPRWKKRLCGRMFKSLMRGYVFPKRTSRRILEVLGGEFPELRERVLPALRAEIGSIGFSEAFHRMAFSRAAVPKTLALFAAYPELDGLWELFLAARKEEFVRAAG